MLLCRFDKIWYGIPNHVICAFQIDLPGLPPTGRIRFTNFLPLIEITGIRIHHIYTTKLGHTIVGVGLVADVGPEATTRFFEFFMVPVRNKNTRIVYYHAIGEFLAWSQRCGFLVWKTSKCIPCRAQTSVRAAQLRILPQFHSRVDNGHRGMTGHPRAGCESPGKPSSPHPRLKSYQRALLSQASDSIHGSMNIAPLGSR